MANKIFSNSDFRDQLSISCSDSSISLEIFSAFIKRNALKWLSESISNIPEVKIIARWEPQDLAFKASDLSVYEFCKKNGWKFGIDNSLHSKAFIFDSKTVLLGSANLTDRGLSISKDGNLEMGTIIEPTIADLQRLKDLERNVTWMNDDLYKEIKEQIDGFDSSRPKVPAWSESLKNKLLPSIEHLWISELLHTKPVAFEWLNLEDVNTQHDLELLSLSLSNATDLNLLRDQFLSCREYRWFKQHLKNAAEDEMTNFGWLSNKLHNALLDKPPPYRKDVKEYVADFVEWLEVFASGEIKITKHERTQSFSLS